MAKMDKAAENKMKEADNPVDILCNVIDGWMDFVRTTYEETTVIIDFWADFIQVVEELNLKEVSVSLSDSKQHAVAVAIGI